MWYVFWSATRGAGNEKLRVKSEKLKVGFYSETLIAGANFQSCAFNSQGTSQRPAPAKVLQITKNNVISNAVRNLFNVVLYCDLAAYYDRN